MTDTTFSQFKDELNSFFVLVLLNMIFGANVMSFGMLAIISSVVPAAAVYPFTLFPALQIVIGAAGVLLGMFWIITGVRVLRGIIKIRRESRRSREPVPPETITGWIVRVLAHYRENKKTLQRMIIICSLGGVIFIALGVGNLVQGFFATVGGGNGVTFATPFVAAAINLTIGIVAIIISIGFRRYSAAWNRRLDETATNETILRQTLEQR